MVKLKVRTFTGDRTGIVDVISGTRVYTHEGSIRMRAVVNYIIRKGGELVLPKVSELAGHRAPSFEIYGGVYGVGQLRIHPGSHAKLYREGHSGCLDCSSRYTGSDFARKYWFDGIIVKGGGKFEVVSAVRDVTRASQLHVENVAVEYNGLVTTDAIDVITKYAKVDYDARLDSSSRGWSASSGPGRGYARYGGAGGAGHGGSGGRGYTCGCYRSRGCYSSGRFC